MMSHSRLAAVALIAFALPLGGCRGSFFGHAFAYHPRVDIRPLERTGTADNQTTIEMAAAPAAAAAPETDRGRGYLSAGQPGLAVEAFQHALGAGEPAAAAANGLAVAYARIGRTDLARRFFNEAAGMDPSNVAYARNLALLDQSEQQLAAARAAAAARVAVQQPAAPAQPAVTVQPAVTASSATGQLVRVSAHEVRIVTAEPRAAPRVMAAAPAVRRFQPVVRVAMRPAQVAPRAAPAQTLAGRFRSLMKVIFSDPAPAPGPALAAEHRFVPLVRISLSEARRLGTVHAGAPEGDGGI